MKNQKVAYVIKRGNQYAAGLQVGELTDDLCKALIYNTSRAANKDVFPGQGEKVCQIIVTYREVKEAKN